MKPKEGLGMKVLLINGSPNRDGVCARALKEVGDALNKNGVDSEVFWIGNHPLGGCIACGYCHEHGECVFKDVVNDFVKKAQTFDGFVFASPTYYAGCAGNFKAFLDRVFYSGGKSFALKPAAAVVSSRRGGSTSVFDEINKYFTISQMPIVSSCYWNEIHGNTVLEAEQDLEGLPILRVLGDNMAYLLKCLDAGKKAGIESQNKTEKPVHTNFIR